MGYHIDCFRQPFGPSRLPLCRRRMRLCVVGSHYNCGQCAIDGRWEHIISIATANHLDPADYPCADGGCGSALNARITTAGSARLMVDGSISYRLLPPTIWTQPITPVQKADAALRCGLALQLRAVRD